MIRIVVCLDCPSYQKGGWCRLKGKDVGALQPACEDAGTTKEERMAAARDLDTKVCRKCGRVLPKENFSKCSHMVDGLQSYCKECSAQMYQEWDKKRKHKKESQMNTETTMPTKRCSKCGKIKPVTEFYKDVKGGYKSQCKACHKETVSARKKAVRAEKKTEREAMKPTETKTCPKCGRELPREAFGHKAEAKDGLQSWCNDCRKGKAPEPEKTEEPKTGPDLPLTDYNRADVLVKDATDRDLADELRFRGYTVQATRTRMIIDEL